MLQKRLQEIDLAIILEEHRLWLKSEGKEGNQANLRSADLTRANFSKIDLSHADLHEARLREANLRDANLSHADMYGVNLRWADLTNADLSHAFLIVNAKLSNANLDHVNLSYAKLSYADLSESNLSNAKLNHAKLSHANLSKAILKDADLCEVSLYEANLSEANLSRANLMGADLTGAKLYGITREDWSIKNIKCDFVYWDQEGEKRTPEDRNFEPGEFEKKYTHQETIRHIVLNLMMSEISFYAGLMIQWRVNQGQPDSPVKFKGQELISDDMTRLTFMDYSSGGERGKRTQDKMDAISENINTYIRIGGLRSEKASQSSDVTTLVPGLYMGPLPIVASGKGVEHMLIERYNHLPTIMKNLVVAIQSA